MPERRFPPGPSMFGAMRGLQGPRGGRDFSALAAFLTRLSQRYGGITHWRLLGRHFFFLDEPALIEELLVLRSSDFMKSRAFQLLKRLVGNGLLSSEEPLHLRQRRMIQPAFHRERIAEYGRTMVALTQTHTHGWPPGTTLEIHREMTLLTLAVAAQTLFSTNVAGQAEVFSAALTAALRAFPAAMSRLGQLTAVLPFLPPTSRFNRARADLDAVIYELIAARRAEPGTGPDDLLGMLLAARDGEAAMDDAQVRDEAMTLFIAGHETTANALTWTWYLLARHPAAAQRLRAELDEVLGGRAPTAADLPQLRFTHDVFAETLRLYPPAWTLGRRAVRDTTIGGYAIPRGSIVLASQLVTQRNARHWPDPDTFAPERWSSGETPPRFAYFPFGGGVRRCIGESFAWMEGVLLIATIAQQFDLLAVDDREVGVEPLVTLRPAAPIRLRVTLREPGPRGRGGMR